MTKGQALRERVSKRGVLASLGRVESAFKLRYMGIGFVWAWLYCSYSTSAVFADRQGVSINADGSWIVSAASVMLAFFIGGALLSRRGGGASTSLPLQVTAPVLLSLGTVFSAGGSHWKAFLWLGGVLTGIGYALLSMLWARALMRLDVEELEVAVPLSSLVVVPCVVVFPHLQGAAGVAATACLPLVSGALLLLCFRGESRQEARSSEVADARRCSGAADREAAFARGASAKPDRAWLSYLLRISLVLCVLYLAIGWQAALADVQDDLGSLVGIDVPLLMSRLASVMLGVAIVFFSKKVSFSGLFRWAIPFTVVALVLLGVPSLLSGFVASAINNVFDMLIDVLVYLFVITFAKAGKVPVALGIGLVNGFVQLGVLLGNMLGSASLDPAAPCDTGAMAAVLICVVALTGVFAPQREPVEEKSELAGLDGAKESTLGACRRLQKIFGLSDRETEIAFLLAQGRSRPYIREKLFISKNTVATHIKHIYRKLGIHSREDLIDLVAQLAESS